MKLKEVFNKNADFSLLARYLVFPILVICLFQFPEFIGSFVGRNIQFTVIQDNPLKISTSKISLPEGRYFVSYGMVRAACDAFLNETVVVSNKSLGNGIKSQLLLGHEFSVRSGQDIILSLKCDLQQGFATSIANHPLVLPAWSGKLIQTYRGFIDIGLGLGSTCFLLLISLFVLSLNRESTRLTGVRELFVFAITGVLSLMSYSQLPRMWLEGPTATLLHILFRNWFTTGSLLVLSTYLGKWKKLSLIFIPISLLYLLFDFKTRTFWPYYRLNYIAIAIITSAFCYSLLRKRDHSKEMQLIRMISICWVFALCMDVYGLYSTILNYNTPIIMALTCTVFVYLLIYDRSKLERLEVGIKRILSIAQNENAPEKTMAEISSLLFEYTKFTRISCYLDTFLLGESSIPGVSMVRIFEKGYRKDTSKDYKIDFTLNRGSKMQEALAAQKVLKGKGTDDGYYLIMPIGKYIAINLSDDHPVSEYQLQTSLETLERMKPGIEAIERRMNEFGTMGGNLLQKLRSHKKETSFQSEMVGIMLDIHDYSKNCQRYKVNENNNPFAKFISTQYLPGLARAVSDLAYPEALEGDLIALVILKDVFSDEASYKSSVTHVLQKLWNYKDIIGLETAQKSGFEKIRFSIAAGNSSATVTMDEYKARTSGDALTIARRILDAAPREAVMVSKNLTKIFDLQNWYIKSERPILVKKDLIEACLLEQEENKKAA